MEKLVVAGKTYNRVALINHLPEIKKLWIEFFKEDSSDFVERYFSIYLPYVEPFVYESEDHKLAIALFLTTESSGPRLIEAIIVPVAMQKKGLMTQLVNNLIDQKLNLIIQAYNWKIYDKFAFASESKEFVYELKSDYKLPTDQTLLLRNYPLLYLPNVMVRNNQHVEAYFQTEAILKPQILVDTERNFKAYIFNKILYIDKCDFAEDIVVAMNRYNAVQARSKTKLSKLSKQLSVVSEEVVFKQLLNGNAPLDTDLFFMWKF